MSIIVENIDNATIEKCRILRAACLENAEVLINSAKTFKGESTAHIRYNLAALALEEVGKAVIFQMNAFGETSDRNDDQQNISTDDHVKKLFWVFFSPLIEQGRIAPEYYRSDRELARRMHERRLETLYTDTQNPLLPQDRMVKEEADSLVRLCETRITMEKGVELSDVPDASKLEVLEWFRTASDDPEKRQYFFSSGSYDKLAELGDLFEWMDWLHEEFTVAEEESKELLSKELEKPPVEDDEGNEPKWKVKFRIYSDSHSIRQRALNTWNHNSDFIMKLHSSNNSNELICEFILPKSVHIRALWNVARGRSRDFVAALNIATSGLFWWHVDKDITRFYEKIWDLELEDDTEVKINISPELRIDWGHQSLTDENLADTRFVLVYLLKDIRSTPQKRDAIENYLTGLALLSKNDVHLRLEPNAFAYFFTAMKTFLLVSTDWDGVEDIKTSVLEQLGELFPPQDLSNYIECGMQLENRENPSMRITISEVIQMKNYCDIYINLLAIREFERHRNLEDSNEE